MGYRFLRRIDCHKTVVICKILTLLALIIRLLTAFLFQNGLIYQTSQFGMVIQPVGRYKLFKVYHN